MIVLTAYKPPLIPAMMHHSNVELAVDQHLRQRQEALQVIRKELTLAQHRMKQMANRKKSEISFEEGNIVYLK